MTSEKKQEGSILFSKRWILAYIGMFVFFVTYSVRVNLSVAVVCMVRSTNNLYDDNQNNTTTIGTEGVTVGALMTPITMENQTHSNCKALGSSSSDVDSTLGEFDWDKSQLSVILSAFFYGYILTQIPGGWIAGRFGGKRVLGGGLLITSCATLLLPSLARLDYRMVIVIRVIIGLSQGCIFPSMHSMWGRWAPPRERTRLTSFSYSGMNIGILTTYMVSGVLCTDGFDNGWGSIFYITGGVGVLCSLLWFYLVSDYPENHSTISVAERDYINKSLAHDTSYRKFKVPWKSILTSKAVWACAISHTCTNWICYTLLTGLPSFMKEVLQFDIQQNGLWSAMPYIAQLVAVAFAGPFSDFLRARYFTTTATRRIMQVSAYLLEGAMIVGVGFVSCDNRMLAVAMLALSLGFDGMCFGGFLSNHVDFAPRYAGVLFGFTNLVATIPGIIAPIVIGALTPNKSQEEWRNVFYVCGGFCLFGALVFGCFAQGEVQSWAMEPPKEHLKSATGEAKKHRTYDGEEEYKLDLLDEYANDTRNGVS